MSTETLVIREQLHDGKEKVVQHCGTEYEEFFDIPGYLQTRYGQGVESPNNPQPVAFQCQTFHEFYSKFHSSWDSSVVRLLEFGGGPAIYPLISACPYVKEIVFTDYVEPCLKEVRLWKDNDPSAHNWDPFFEYVVNHLEGKEGEDAVTLRKEELREKIVSIEHCDITKPHSVIDPKLGVFDVVSTSLCLEAVAETKEDYVEFLKRIAPLTKVGGYLVTLVSIGMSHYRLMGVDFKHLPLSQDDVCSGLETAGFTVESVQYYPLESHRRVVGQYDCVGKAIFVAKRLEYE